MCLGHDISYCSLSSWRWQCYSYDGHRTFVNSACIAKRPQDYPVLPKHVVSLWQQHKLAHETTQEQLLKTRTRGCDHYIHLVKYVAEEEESLTQAEEREKYRRQLAKCSKAFIVHAVVQDWILQYNRDQLGVLHRFRILLLLGETQAGKSMFAKNIFGFEQTLVLNCQKGSTSLPSMRHFRRRKHKAILLDEVTVAHVLEFKQLLQSTVEPFELGQSQCGQFRYNIWVYGVAWILCSNDFSFDEKEGKISKQDSDWLKENITTVELPSGEKWYVSE